MPIKTSDYGDKREKKSSIDTRLEFILSSYTFLGLKILLSIPKRNKTNDSYGIISLDIFRTDALDSGHIIPMGDIIFLEICQQAIV